jgi:hypothetical protein
MDTFLKYVTAQNAPAWRDEIFAGLQVPSTISGGGQRPGWSLEREGDLERIRFWIQEAVRPGSQLAQLYRELEPEFDLENDIVRSLPAFERTPCFGKLESHYALRMLWRVLMRRYGFVRAGQVGRYLSRGESWVWRWWRRKDYLLPRLAVGVLLGFFTLGASSGVVDAIYKLRLATWWPVPVVCLVVVGMLSLTDVQRRLGRARFRAILSRAIAVVGFGVFYAASGAGLLYWHGGKLGYSVCHYEAEVAMCGGVALLLGFVFQLFWQDRSIGEPL